MAKVDKENLVRETSKIQQTKITVDNRFQIYCEILSPLSKVLILMGEGPWTIQNSVLENSAQLILY